MNSLRWFNALLFALTAGVLFVTGCASGIKKTTVPISPSITKTKGSSSQTPIITTTDLPYPFPEQATGYISAMPPYPIEPEPPSAISASTKTPVPTVTPLPSPTSRGIRYKPSCNRGDEYTSCDDEIAQLSFEYPNDWGSIEALLWEGDTGYGYNYLFSGAAQDINISAGGRSRDFTEGRGGMITDFSGYNLGEEHNLCSYERRICQEIQPNVLLMLDFPQAKYVCDPAPGIVYYPLALVAINLSESSIIDGFVFATGFLSEKLKNEIGEILGIDDSNYPSHCDDESRELFDQRISETIVSIQSNAVDNETLENLERIRLLARSIMFR